MKRKFKGCIVRTPRTDSKTHTRFLYGQLANVGTRRYFQRAIGYTRSEAVLSRSGRARHRKFGPPDT